MAIKATVIIPTFNHGKVIKYPLLSILDQTVQSFEIFVIGDGLTPELKKEIAAICKMDERINFISFPKHPRNGEDYRHQIITKQAKGKYIFYLADDDLWLPNHLEVMIAALEDHDFAHGLHTDISPDGSMVLLPTDLSLPIHRQWIQDRWDFGNGLSFAAHSKKFYLENLIGWRTTPKGIYTDTYMWRQFAEHKECRIVATYKPTAIKFASPMRKEWTIEQKAKELGGWYKKVSNEKTRIELVNKIYDTAISKWINTDIALIAYMKTVADLRDMMAVKKFPGVKKMIRQAVKPILRR